MSELYMLPKDPLAAVTVPRTRTCIRHNPGTKGGFLLRSALPLRFRNMDHSISSALWFSAVLRRIPFEAKTSIEIFFCVFERTMKKNGE